jgi:hypothetical protein
LGNFRHHTEIIERDRQILSQECAYRIF